MNHHARVKCESAHPEAKADDGKIAQKELATITKSRITRTERRSPAFTNGGALKFPGWSEVGHHDILSLPTSLHVTTRSNNQRGSLRPKLFRKKQRSDSGVPFEFPPFCAADFCQSLAPEERVNMVPLNQPPIPVQCDNIGT